MTASAHPEPTPATVKRLYARRSVARGRTAPDHDGVVVEIDFTRALSA